MDKRILILIAVIAAAMLLTQGLPASYFGGTVLSVNAVDITNSPNAPFQKEIIANVLLDGGANYLSAVSSTPITATANGQSSKPFTVDFQLNKYECPYSISNAKHTISFITLANYNPPNSNNAYTSNPWSAQCRASAALNTLFSNEIYKSYRTGGDPFNAGIYCHAVFNSCVGDDHNDFIGLCKNQPGFKAVPCTLPSAANAALGANINVVSGYSCVRLDDRVVGTGDYQVQELTAAQPKFSAVVNVRPASGVAEQIVLNDANTYTANSQDVYVRSTANLGSNQNPPCANSESVVFVSKYDGTKGTVSKSEYTRMETLYTTTKQSVLNANSLDSMLTQVNEFDSQLFSTALNTIDTTTFTVGSGQLTIDRTQTPPNLPWLTLYINADWVGIVNPVATVALSAVSPNPLTFTSGNTATGSINVINTAATGGSITVGLPTCEPAASFVWVNNPNRNYNSGESYTASFSTTASPNTNYACSITAQSGGFVVGGNYQPTKAYFTMNVAQQCTNSANPPFVRMPTAADPCRVVCPLDPVIAGRDVCGNSGLVYNSTQCACVSKPNCEATNSCPVKPFCDDNTAIGVCNNNGQRCNVVANVPVLQADGTCGKPCVGADCNKNFSCFPIFQKESTSTVGATSFLGFTFGGVPVQSCVWDFTPIGIGLLAVAGILLLKFKKKEEAKAVGVAALLILVLSFVADNALLIALGGTGIFLIAAVVAVGYVVIKLHLI